MIMAIMSFSNLNAQFTVTIISNSADFCESTCDTLDLSAEVYLNGVLQQESSVSYSWTGPNGWNSTMTRPRVPITDLAQDGDYCLTVSTFQTPPLEASDCLSVVVESTIEWVCDPMIMVTGVDCDTDLIDHSFTIDAMNCGFTAVDWTSQILVDGLPFYTDGAMGAAVGTHLVGEPDPDPMIQSIVADLPFGTHEIVTTLTDPNDPAKVLAQCETELRVVESINNVACNDDINITLNELCEAILTPDMMLEGTYCFANMTLEIDGFTPANTLTLDAPGDYVVTVTGVSGISCWGTIHAEDKSTPILDCEDFEVYCSESEFIDPGQSIRGFGRAMAEEVTVSAGSSNPIVMQINGVSGTVSNIVLNFHGEIESVKDLEIELTDPNNLRTNLVLDLDDIGLANECDGSNIDVCLQDTDPNFFNVDFMTHDDFGSLDLCRTTQNAFIGVFQPHDLFSGFNGLDAGGNWTLEVYNNGATDMTIVKADLRIETIEGNIPTANDIVVEDGCSSAIIDGPNDELVGVDCENGYWNTIERTWVVTNPNSGNSATCSQLIQLRRWGVNDIIWPKNYDDLELPVIHCFDLFNQFTGELDNSLVTADSIPKSSVTGAPRVPFGEVCGNFQMTYEDLKFRICGKYASKTIRTWSVLDWCTGDLVHHDQIIKISDDEPIVVSCQPDNVFDVYTNSYDCTGDWEVVPPLNFTNSCDADIVWQVHYLVDDDEDPNDPPLVGDYITNPNNDVIENLPAGRRTWIKYTAVDACGNTGECFTEVDVHDDDKPNPVCIEFTVVALSNDGCAKLHAESLDNGSWDNCGIESFHIRKSNQTQWSDYIEYCCNQGCFLPNQMVHLLVTDTNNNTNTCEVEVEIQDNIPATITQRPQSFYSFDCSVGEVDIASIILTSQDQFAYEDNCDPNNDGVFSINVEWTRSDGGGLNDPFVPQDCGQGSLSINWIIRDECGNQIGTHFQNIQFQNNASNFTVNWPFDPAPYQNCNTADMLHPDNLPSIHTVDFSDVNTFACNSSIAITWDDLIFENVEGSCMKILRTWTVIDWCIADRYGLDAGTQEHTQILRIHDIVGPNIGVASVVDFDATTDACTVAINDSLLVADVTDDCTDMFSNQEIDTRYEINYADGGFFAGTGTDARGSYPYGTSTIRWISEDHCGNVSERTTLVRVNDVKPPTPYCLGIIVTATMVDDNPVEIWASDFNVGGFDNVTGNTACGNFGQIDVYFLNEFNQEVDFLSFDCSDVPNGVEQEVILEVYYEDEAGNRDFCIVTLLLQDNVNDVCPDDPQAGSRIAGTVETEEAITLENVKVEVTSNSPDYHKTAYTNSGGDYAFNNLTSGATYFVNASMEDNPLNGVSTLDLVLIQRHILGIATLDSPYKLIAADADNSGNISATDLIALRKLLLGIYEEFPNGQDSWRFPEKGQHFTDPEAPFPYNETINTGTLSSNMVGQDFTAVKIGDVNGSAELNAQGPTLEENRKLVSLEMNEISFTGGELITVPVYARNMNDLVGFQNTINFDTDALEFTGLESEALDVSDDYIGTQGIEEGMVTLSWHNAEGVYLDEETALFNLTFQAKANANLSEVIYLSSAITNSEAYNNDLDVMDLNLNFRNSDQNDFILYQNIPNPFNQSTEVRFSIPSESDVTFSVFDVNGRELLRETVFYTAGDHTITLSKDQLQATGVMYYTVETKFGVASRKMIQIK